MKQKLSDMGRKRGVARARRHALAHALLGGLALCGGVVLMTAPGLSEILRRGPFGNHSPRAAARALESLYQKGLVVLTGTPGARRATLTTKGEQVAHLHALALPHNYKKTWNGLWYMIAFDIPMRKNHARTALRRTLKRVGFVEYQKSLYVYPCGCESEVDFITRFFGVEKFVRSFYATDLEDEQKYHKLFNLA